MICEQWLMERFPIGYMRVNPFLAVLSKRLILPHEEILVTCGFFGRKIRLIS